MDSTPDRATALFSRRGFTRLALLGTAGLWMPRIAEAQALPQITARFASAGGMRVELYVRSRGREGVELLAHTVRLVGTLSKANQDAVPITLESEHVARRAMSRVGFRIGEKLAIAPGEEVLYDTFAPRYDASPLPITGGAVLTLAAELTVTLDERPEGERPGMRALSQLRGSLPVNLA